MIKVLKYQFFSAFLLVLITGCHTARIIVTDMKGIPIENAILVQKGNYYPFKGGENHFYLTDSKGRATLKYKQSIVIGKKGFYPVFVASNVPVDTQIKLAKIGDKKNTLCTPLPQNYRLVQIYEKTISEDEKKIYTVWQEYIKSLKNNPIYYRQYYWGNGINGESLGTRQ
jgi:hypothetical protein